MTAPATAPSLLVFPTDFPIKVMGPRVDGFTQQIVAVVREHFPDFDSATIEVRASKFGNYLSLTATVRATSREQLDTLYRALTGHPLVKIVL
jgi:putative lipoic acid-binding regulatory protein